MRCETRVYTNTSIDPMRANMGPARRPTHLDANNLPAQPFSLGIDVSGFQHATGTVIIVTPVTLAQVIVPTGACATLKGIWQFASIGAPIANDDGSLYLDPFPVTTPTWTFQDGWINWHVTIAQGFYQLEDAPQVTSQEGFANLGFFTDMRFPWGAAPNALELGPVVQGPALLSFWVDILQTDPGTRPKLKVPAGTLQLFTPETQYIGSVTEAVYQRVAGALIVETKYADS